MLMFFYVVYLPILITAVAGACPSNFINGPSSCYLGGCLGCSWEEGNDFCASHNSHLVTVRSGEENVYIGSTFGGVGNPLWIGLSDNLLIPLEESSTYSWGWEYGSSDYTNWNVGEPVESSDGCALINGAQYQWIAIACSATAIDQQSIRAVCAVEDMQTSYTPSQSFQVTRIIVLLFAAGFGLYAGVYVFKKNHPMQLTAAYLILEVVLMLLLLYYWSLIEKLSDTLSDSCMAWAMSSQFVKVWLLFRSLIVGDKNGVQKIRVVCLVFHATSSVLMYIAAIYAEHSLLGFFGFAIYWLLPSVSTTQWSHRWVNRLFGTNDDGENGDSYAPVVVLNPVLPPDTHTHITSRGDLMDDSSMAASEEGLVPTVVLNPLRPTVHI